MNNRLQLTIVFVLCVISTALGQQTAHRVVSSALASEHLLVEPKVPYPQLAQAARIRGTVVLKATIAADGSVKELRLVSGHPMLVQSAMEAVKNWRYQPFLFDGNAAEVDTEIAVAFGVDSNATAAAIKSRPATTPNVLLWDARKDEPWVERTLAANYLSQVTAAVRERTGSRAQVRITSSIVGRFLANAISDQLLVEAEQSDGRRSMAEGDRVFFALFTGSRLQLIEAEVGGDLVQRYRVPGESSDFALLDSKGGAQGDNRDYFRLLSFSDGRFHIVRDMGVVKYDNCATGAPTGVVADVLWLQRQPNKSVLARDHFFKRCGDSEFRFLGSDSNDAEDALLQRTSLSRERVKEVARSRGAQPQTNTEITVPSKADSKATDASESTTARTNTWLKKYFSGFSALEWNNQHWGDYERHAEVRSGKFTDSCTFQFEVKELVSVYRKGTSERDDQKSSCVLNLRGLRLSAFLVRHYDPNAKGELKTSDTPQWHVSMYDPDRLQCTHSFSTKPDARVAFTFAEEEPARTFVRDFSAIAQYCGK